MDVEVDEFSHCGLPRFIISLCRKELQVFGSPIIEGH
jgi:hypothetical protein